MNLNARVSMLVITVAVMWTKPADSFSSPLRPSRRWRSSSLLALHERPKDDPSLQTLRGGYGQYLNVRKENKTLYDVLRCPPDATREQLKRAYIELARETHPDALIAMGVPTDSVDPSAFDEIANAWKILSDERERMRYDKRLRAKRLTTVFDALVSWAAELVTSFIPPPKDAVNSAQTADDPRNIETWEMNGVDEYHHTQEHWFDVGVDEDLYTREHWGDSSVDENVYIREHWGEGSVDENVYIREHWDDGSHFHPRGH